MSNSVLERVSRNLGEIPLQIGAVNRIDDTDGTIVFELRVHMAAPPEIDRDHQLFAKQSSISHGALAAQIIKERALRTRHIDAGLMGEPAWNMLLDLFQCHQSRRTVSVTSLCVAACVPGTTALRYIAWLEKENLIVRHKDESDGRRSFVSLTETALEAMTHYLNDVALARGIDLLPTSSASGDAPMAGLVQSPRYRQQK
jgi:DNA-binding MarR family transcriptional regulator